MARTVFVVVACHNAEGYVAACVASLRTQTWSHVSVVVVDDASDDATPSRLDEAIDGDERFRVCRSARRVGAGRARHEALSVLDAGDDDIVLLVDGDDRLLHDRAIEVVVDMHDTRELLFAYGNHVTLDGTRPQWAREYSLHAKMTGARREGWRISHPRSFRHGLWRRLGDGYLAGPDGRDLRSATDLALCLPMVEMAGFRVGYCDEPIYRYRRHERNLDRIARSDQERNARFVLSMPPMTALSDEEQRTLVGATRAGARPQRSSPNFRAR